MEGVSYGHGIIFRFLIWTFREGIQKRPGMDNLPFLIIFVYGSRGWLKGIDHIPVRCMELLAYNKSAALLLEDHVTYLAIGY